MKKRLLRLLLVTAVLTFLCTALSSASYSDTITLRVNPYGGREDSIDTIEWFKIDKIYYFFLPSDTENAVLYVSPDENIYVNGKSIKNGDKNVFDSDGTYFVSCGYHVYTVRVLYADQLPSMFIETESGSLDYLYESKNNKEKGSIRLYENGTAVIDTSLKQIKGRGNATWKEKKRPFNIKFDKKTEVLGMPKAKKWALLACWNDKSLCENALGFYYAEAFGLSYTSEYRFVNAYFNGIYYGVYMVCENVEVGKNRVDIFDLDEANEKANPGMDLDELPAAGTGVDGKPESTLVPGSMKWVDIPNDPETIDGGYIFEVDFLNRYNDEKCGFITTQGQAVTIKYPENATRKEVEYAYGVFNPALEALFSADGYNTEGEYYTEYFDIESLTNMYILQELASNIDAGISSFFFVKKEGSDQLVCGPAWDFDTSFSISDRFQKNVWPKGENYWLANSMYTIEAEGRNSTDVPTIFERAYRHMDFREGVEKRWAEIREKGIIESGLDLIKKQSKILEKSASMNFIRWQHYSTVPDGLKYLSYRQEVEDVICFTKNRARYLSKGFAGDSAMLYYESNGGKGWLYQSFICSVGDSLTVMRASGIENLILRNIEAPCIVSGKKGTVFKCWNTEPDGSGKNYYPGQKIVLRDRTTVLYAQWVELNR